MIERDRVGALRQLQKDLMDNLAPLSYRTPIKEVITKALEIEDLLKAHSGNTGKSPLEETREFLTSPSPLTPDLGSGKAKVN